MKRKVVEAKLVSILICIVILVASTTHAVELLTLATDPYTGKRHLAVANELVVAFAPNAHTTQITALHWRIGARVIQTFPEFGVHVVQLPRGVSVDVARVYYATAPIVRYAEPCWIRLPTYVPNDPRFPEQWAHQVAKSTEAWNISVGESWVVVAIIDTGIDLNHEDLRERIWVNKGEIPNNGMDDDGNGYVDDYYGYNFANNTPDPSPDPKMSKWHHGTHVAGIVAATIDNNVGVVGVAGRCRVMALNVFGQNERSKSPWIADAIRYAADMGAHVINMSLGAPVPSQLEADAISYAFHPSTTGRPGLVVVAAAGNEPYRGGVEIGPNNPWWPVCADGDENMVLGVAATGPGDLRAYYSNYGEPPCIDVSAPGGDMFRRQRREDGILSCMPNNQYEFLQGTSMAAPFVAGLAALIKSVAPDLSNIQIRDIIINSADPIDALNPGYEGKLGSGRVNVKAAIDMAIAYEPNNNPQQAFKRARISIGPTYRANLNSPTDPDYYYFRVSRAQKLTARVAFPQDVRPGILVFRSYGATYMGRVVETGVAEVTFFAIPGDYYLFIYAATRRAPWSTVWYTFSVHQAQ